MILNKTTIVAILILFVLSCQQNDKKSHSKLKGNNTCYNIKDDKICVPKKWKVKKQSKYLFFCSLNGIDTVEYFVVLKYNKLSKGLSINTYLKETYKVLRNDTVEIASGYTSKKLTCKNGSSYYSEYHTKLHDKSYITLSMLFEDNDNIYEFALKANEKNFSMNKTIFGNILFESQMNHRTVFYEGDEILKSEIIDLSKL